MAVVTTEGGGSTRESEPKPRPKGGAVQSGTPVQEQQGAEKLNKRYGDGPIQVWHDPAVNAALVKGAVERWNRQAGFRVFSLVGSYKVADVIIKLGTNFEKHAPEAGAFTASGLYTLSGKTQIRIRPEYGAVDAPADRGSELVFTQMMQHELGHALGIDHPGPEANPYLRALNTTGEVLTPPEIDKLFKQSRQSGIVGSARRISTDEAAFAQDIRGADASDDEEFAKVPPEKLLYDWVSGGGSGGGGTTPPPTTNPPPTTTTTHTTTASSSSSSSGSSAPPYDSYISDQFKQDAVARQKAQMFAQAYTTLWGEPATETYLVKAVKTGMNVTEFVHHERMKGAFQDSKTYKDEAKSIVGLLKQMAAI